jgi:hypothetical protein
MDCKRWVVQVDEVRKSKNDTNLDQDAKTGIYCKASLITAVDVEGRG